MNGYKIMIIRFKKIFENLKHVFILALHFIYLFYILNDILKK